MKKYTADQVVKMGICYSEDEIKNMFYHLGKRKAGFPEALKLWAKNVITAQDVGWIIAVNKVVDYDHFERAFRCAFKFKLDEEQRWFLSCLHNPYQPTAIKIGYITFLLGQMIRVRGVTKTISIFKSTYKKDQEHVS